MVLVDPTEINVGKNIILCADIFYVGGLTFIMSKSRGIGMSMVNHLENRKVSSLHKYESAINVCTSDLNTKSVTVN